MSFTGGQMSESVSILIPTRRAFEAIELTIESVLMNTWYDNFKIIVCDNSGGEGEGNRFEYLKKHEKNGTLRLIESSGGKGDWELKDGMWQNSYGHGVNLKILLKACDTDYAMLLSSGIEVLKTDWLDTFMAMLKTGKDLGAARLRPVRMDFDDVWAAPCWWPNLMLLNMKLYRKIMLDRDWDLARIAYEDYEHKNIFNKKPSPEKSDSDRLMIWLDTGYFLWERLEYNNSEGYRMVNFDTNPVTFQWCWLFGYYIGLDRNSHRPEHSFVVSQRTKIQERLRILRCQN